MVEMHNILAVFSLASFVVSLAFMGVSMGLSYMLNRKQRSEDPNDNYSWQRQTTQRSTPKEEIYGTYKIVGNVIARDFEVVNEQVTRTTDPDDFQSWVAAIKTSPFFQLWVNQGLEVIPASGDPIKTILTSTLRQNVILAHGLGPCQGVLTDPELTINGQVHSQITGVSVSHEMGTSTQTATGYGNIIEIEVGRDVHEAEPITFETKDADYTRLGIVIACLDGLLEYEDDGGRSLNALGVKIEIRVLEGSWHTLVDEILYAGTPNAVREIYYTDQTYHGGSAFSITPGDRHEIKVTCTDEDNDGDLEFGTLTVEAYQEIYIDNPVFPGLFLTTISAVPDDEVNGQIEVFGIARHKVVPIWDSGTESFSIEFTETPAWVGLHRWTGALIAGDGDTTPYSVDRYRGIGPDHIDLDEFEAWADFCDELVPDGNGSTEPRYIISGRFANTESRSRSAGRVAAMSRAKFWCDGRKLRCWVDKQTTPSFLICRSSAYRYTEKTNDKRNMPSVIEMDCELAENNYERQQVRAADTQATHYHKESMDGFGCPTRSQAARHCQYIFDKNRLCNLLNEWTGGPVMGDIEPGHVGYCANDNNDKTLSGRVIEVYDDGVLLDLTPAAQTGGVDYSLVIQTFHATGGRTVHRYDEVTLSDSVVTLADGDSFTTTPEVGDEYIYAPEANLDLFRVIGRSGDTEHRWSFVGEHYTDAFYANDSEAPTIDTTIEKIQSGGGSRVGRPVTRAELKHNVPETLTGSPQNDASPKVGNLLFEGDGVDTVTWTGTGSLQYAVIKYQGGYYPIRQNTTGTSLEYIYFDAGTSGYTVSNITLPSGSPLVVTVSSHPWETGDVVRLFEIEGIENLGGFYKVTATGENTFTLDDTDGDDYSGTFSSGLAANNPTELYATDALSDLAQKECFVLCINSRGQAKPVTPCHVDEFGRLVSEDNLIAGAFNSWMIEETFEDAGFDDFARRWFPVQPGVIDTCEIVAGGNFGGKVLRITATSEAAVFFMIESMAVQTSNILNRCAIRVKLVSGSATLSAGVMGSDADDNFVDKDGGNSSSTTDHYNCTAYGLSLTVGQWVLLEGYFKGTAAAGTQGASPSPNNPSLLHTDVKRVRPFFAINSGTYVVEIDAIWCYPIDTSVGGILPGFKHITDDYEITDEDLIGQAYDNTGSTKNIEIQLPAATPDKVYRIFNMSASYTIDLVPAGGQTHLLGSTDQKLRLTGKGVGVTLGCPAAGTWYNSEVVGTPTYVS